MGSLKNGLSSQSGVSKQPAVSGRCMVWYRLVWFCLVSYSIIWYGFLLFVMIWYGRARGCMLENVLECSRIF